VAAAAEEAEGSACSRGGGQLRRLQSSTETAVEGKGSTRSSEAAATTETEVEVGPSRRLRLRRRRSAVRGRCSRGSLPRAAKSLLGLPGGCGRGGRAARRKDLGSRGRRCGAQHRHCARAKRRPRVARQLTACELAWRGAAHAQEGGAAGRCISGWLGLPEARGAAGPEMTAWGRGRQGRCRKRRGCEEHRGHCTTGTARRGGRTRAARPTRWLQHWTSSGLQRWAARLLAACTLDHCRLGADAGREERRRGRRGGTSG
jgi:hypothetical protein